MWAAWPPSTASLAANVGALDANIATAIALKANIRQFKIIVIIIDFLLKKQTVPESNMLRYSIKLLKPSESIVCRPNRLFVDQIDCLSTKCFQFANEKSCDSTKITHHSGSLIQGNSRAGICV